MELDVIRKRAEVIQSGVTSQNRLNYEFRIFPEQWFTCSGQITGLLLGADIVSENSNAYPQVQVWRNTGGDTYTRQASHEIRLIPGDFSPDGVLRYTLTSPLSFQSGDVLGVYQLDRSDTVVGLYYFSNASAPVSYSMTNNPTSAISLSSLLAITGQVTLITPITSEFSKFWLIFESSECVQITDLVVKHFIAMHT